MTQARKFKTRTTSLAALAPQPAVSTSAVPPPAAGAGAGKALPLLNVRNQRICNVDIRNICAVFESGHALVAIANEESSCGCVCEWPAALDGTDLVTPFTSDSSSNGHILRWPIGDGHGTRTDDLLVLQMHSVDCDSGVDDDDGNDDGGGNDDDEGDEIMLQPRIGKTDTSRRDSGVDAALSDAAKSSEQRQAYEQLYLPEGPGAAAFFRLAGNTVRAFESLLAENPQVFVRVPAVPPSGRSRQAVAVAVNRSRAVGCQRLSLPSVGTGRTASQAAWASPSLSSLSSLSSPASPAPPSIPAVPAIPAAWTTPTSTDRLDWVPWAVDFGLRAEFAECQEDQLGGSHGSCGMLAKHRVQLAVLGSVLGIAGLESLSCTPLTLPSAWESIDLDGPAPVAITAQPEPRLRPGGLSLNDLGFGRKPDPLGHEDQHYDVHYDVHHHDQQQHQHQQRRPLRRTPSPTDLLAALALSSTVPDHLPC